MLNPWDRPPFPLKGDIHQDTTYEAVGKVLSSWEEAEMELSHLFAIFIGKYQVNEAYDMYYEQGKTNQNRLTTVEVAAQRFFQKKPSQIIEGEFCGLIRRIRGFCERRHEVAHGHVQPIQWYGQAIPNYEPPVGVGFHFCLVPPHYQRNWFNEKHMPVYVYTSIELNELNIKLFSLMQDILTFKFSIQPPNQ